MRRAKPNTSRRWNSFPRGYGSTAVDPVALACYRQARAVGAIGAYGEQVLLLPTVGEASTRNAVQRLLQLFEPGYIVSLASQLECFST